MATETPKEPLFFSDSEEEAPAPKSKPKAKQEQVSSDIVMLDPSEVNPAAFKKRKPAKTRAPDRPTKRMRMEATQDDPIPLDEFGEPLADWRYKLLGTFPGTGWLTGSSKLVKLSQGEKVTFEYEALRQDPKKKAISAKEKPNLLINFKNSRGFECGRLVKDQASFVASLMELSVIKIEGSVLSIPKKFDSGTDCLLSIHVYIHVSAFQTLDQANAKESGTLPANGKAKEKVHFRDEVHETDTERRFKARKSSLNRLFDALGLRPVRSSSVIKSQRAAGGAMDSILVSRKKDKKGKTKVEDDDDEGDLDSKQVEEIYARASRNDMNLPEMSPSESFKLDLRPYQKQALQWMTTMEGAEEDARQSLALHPLYEEYIFPPDGPDDDSHIPFYYTPYSGELTLKFPQASKRCRGGILADEMGLGKTIMMAALIHTNRISNDSSHSEDSSVSSAEEKSDDSDAPYNPSPVKRQSKLSTHRVGLTSSPKWNVSGAAGATLVVCPMSLLSQWQSEIERSMGTSNVNVILYYGAGRGDLEDDIEGAGLSVVVTSYGTLASEFQRISNNGKISRSKRAGLFGIDWYRIILDEAHTIKSRTTHNAKACYALKGKRRWCLSGTPITNRLEDLYSLLHFIRLEPWGNFSYFRSFITVPFQNKDPKAIHIVQIILESILLRREKNMKDRDGQPIVALPAKTIIEERLEFNPAEREIYDLIYKDARSMFLGYKAEGNVMKNVTAIFAVLMRLRQAVLHPALVLKNIASRAEAEGLTTEDAKIKSLILKYCASAKSASAGQDILKTLEGNSKDSECLWCMSVPVSPVRLPCGHIGCKECVVDTFTAQSGLGQETACEVCQKPASEDDLVPAQPAKRETETPEKVKQLGTSSTAAIEISDSEADAGDAKLPALAARTLGNADFRASTKLDALIKHLNVLRNKQPKYHAVVFSQFTSFMDLIERVLAREKIEYARLDGSFSQRQRARVIQEFNNPGHPCVLLVSLKAGGTGLNLTIADHAFLLDFWWNAAIENQAIDRIHRFGQLREVTVLRFIIDKSIEDRMIALQRRKTAIINAGLGTSSGTAEADFDVIFGLEDAQKSS